MQVVGTRGDVQPFLAVALELKAHGHRVRLAAHATYRMFVETQGIEFYPLGGGSGGAVRVCCEESWHLAWQCSGYPGAGVQAGTVFCRH